MGPLQNAIDDLREAWNVPGVAVVTFEGFQADECHLVGYSSVANEIPIAPETLYPMTCMSKTVVGFICAFLVEKGLINFDDRVVEFIPELTATNEQLTVRHLLTNRSGYTLPDLFSVAWCGAKELIEFLARKRGTYPPGQVYSYVDATYILLGELITRVTGESWAAFTERVLRDELGLRTVCATPSRWRAGESLAQGYGLATDKAIHLPTEIPDFSAASGGIAMTIADLCTWLKILLTGANNVLSRPVVSRWFRPEFPYSYDQRSSTATEEIRRQVISITYPFADVVEIGLGVWIETVGSVPLLGFQGSSNGFDSSIGFDPTSGWGYFIASNGSMRYPAVNPLVHSLRKLLMCRASTGTEIDALKESVSRHEQCQRYLQIFESLVKTTPKQSLTTSAKALQDDAGIYENSECGCVAIGREKDSLILRFHTERFADRKLVPVGADRYRCVNPNDELENFERVPITLWMNRRNNSINLMGRVYTRAEVAPVFETGG